MMSVPVIGNALVSPLIDFFIVIVAMIGIMMATASITKISIVMAKITIATNQLS